MKESMEAYPVYLLQPNCVPSPLHLLTNFAFWLLNNSAWCHWAWSVSVYCINHCSCLLLPLWRPLKCSGRLSDFWSILAAPGHVFIGHFPFPPYSLYSLLFPLLRCSQTFELAGCKMKKIQRHLIQYTIYVSLSVRCTICFDVSSDV